MAGSPAQLASAQRGLADLYAGLHAHQLALYHGLPLAEAKRLKAGVRGLPTSSECFTDRISIGGLGSGKSHGAITTLLGANISFEDNLWLVLRKRHEQMENSIIRLFTHLADAATNGHREWILEELPENHGASEFKVFTKGKPSLVVFRIEPDGDDATIQDSLKAYEIGGYLLEEATQLQQITFNTIRSRLRLKNVARMGLTLANPAPIGHWLTNYARKQELMASDGLRPDCVVIRSKTRDNAAFQSDGYEAYIRGIYGDDENMIAMMLEGEDGVSMVGQPVFKGYFKPSTHVDREIRVNPFLPIYRGLDFGFRKPFTIWLQREKSGHITVVAELSIENITADSFAQQVAAYTSEHMPKYEYLEDWGDPAMILRSDKSEDTTRDIFSRHGFKIRYKRLHIKPGLDLLRYLMSTHRPDTMGNVRPLLSIHPRCQELITALHLGYHYRKLKSGMLDAEPHKDDIHDHAVDALRYVLTGICGLPTGGTNTGKGPIVELPSPMRPDREIL